MEMNRLSGFFDLLIEPLKILSQNRKLMAITAIIYLTIYSISFLLLNFLTTPILYDLVLNIVSLVTSQPGTPEYTQLLVAIRVDIGLFLEIEAAYAVLVFFVVLFAETVVIIIASSYYNGESLSLQEIILKVSKTWTRPFVTLFYVHLLALGYTSFFFLPFLVPSLVLFDHRAILSTVLIFLAILYITFYISLFVVWSLAVVVSVNEDSYGLSALGKARELVTGKRVYGFLLTLTFLVVLLVGFIVGSKLSPVMPNVVGVIQTLFCGIVSIYQFMAFTAFYFQCKNDRKLGGSEYTKIQSAPELLMKINFPKKYVSYLQMFSNV